MRLKTVRQMTIHTGPKWKISTIGGFRLLPMVLVLDTKQCVREDVGPPRVVDCEIPYGLERRMKHSLYGCGNLSLIDEF